MSLFVPLRTFLLADVSIAALVGSRVWPVKLPQKAATPAITITRVTTGRAWILDGPAPLAHPRYQIDCWRQEEAGVPAFEQVRELADLVRARLEAYSGTMLDPSTSPDSRVRVWVHLADERELFESDVGGGWWRHSADYEIWHRTRLN